MNTIKELTGKINIDKTIKISAIAIGAIGVIYALYFFIANCFDTTKTKFYNGYFAVILIIMIALTIYLVRFLVLDREWTYSRVFVVLALGWSICIQLVMPPISGVDEVSHYYSAYHCSNILMGMKDHDFDTDPDNYGSWITGTSYFYMRAEDYYNLPYLDVTFPYQYQILADGNWFHCSDEAAQLVPCYEAPSQARRYIISGIGITIARLLHFGFVGTIFMGRFMNSLTLIFAGWLCIKLLTIGKLQLVSFALFPTVLELCGSYSYDNMSILFSIILFSLCLYFSRDDVRLHAWHFILLGISAAMLIPNKTVYVLFAIWILIIPVKKWWKDVCLSKKWYEYATIAIILVGAVVVFKKLVVKYYYRVLSQMVWVYENKTIDQDSTRASYTWQYMTAHPIETLKFAWSGIKVDFWYNIKHVVGCQLGHVKLNAEVPIACTIVILACLIVSLFINKGKRLKKWQYVIVALGLIGCTIAIFIGCLTRFTPAEGSERIQISYRYLIPVYMCMSVALGTDAKENRRSLVLILVQNTALIFTMCGLLYFLFHLRDGMGVPEILQGIIAG